MCRHYHINYNRNLHSLQHNATQTFHSVMQKLQNNVLHMYQIVKKYVGGINGFDIDGLRLSLDKHEAAGTAVHKYIKN